MYSPKFQMGRNILVWNYTKMRSQMLLTTMIESYERFLFLEKTSKKRKRREFWFFVILFSCGLMKNDSLKQEKTEEKSEEKIECKRLSQPGLQVVSFLFPSINSIIYQTCSKGGTF